MLCCCVAVIWSCMIGQDGLNLFLLNRDELNLLPKVEHSSSTDLLQYFRQK